MILTSANNKRLNTKQLSILDTLYSFRFGTTDLLAKALNVKTKNKMNERLKVLLDQEYISRHYEPGYRLLGKYASYFLLPKGIKALRQSNDKYDEVVLHNIYKDKSASEQFINHNLAVFNIYCELKSKYGEQVRFFTKSQLSQYEYFPKPLPDAYVRVQADDETQYFIEILETQRPFFISARKLKHYITYSETGEWVDTGTTLPTVILLCDSNTLKKRMDKQTLKLDDADSEEVDFIVCTRISDIL